MCQQNTHTNTNTNTPHANVPNTNAYAPRLRYAECLVCGTTVASPMRPGRKSEICSDKCRKRYSAITTAAWKRTTGKAKVRAAQLRAKLERLEKAMMKSMEKPKGVQ